MPTLRTDTENGSPVELHYIATYGTDRVAKAVLAAAVPPYLYQSEDNPDGGLDDATIESFEAGIRGDRLAFLEEFTLDCVAAFGRTDFRDDLTKMAVPTLVIHGDCDGTVPFEVSGKRSHEAITGASSSSSRAPRTASTSPTPRSSTPRCWRSSRSRSGADVPGHDGGPGTRFRSQADVLFAFNKATLSRRARSRIAAAVRALRERKPRRVRVVGYTDSKGSEAFNLGLSRRRAAAVARALRAALGGQAPLLVTQGRGEADPVASNTRNGTDDPRGRARNRRVELVYG